MEFIFPLSSFRILRFAFCEIIYTFTSETYHKCFDFVYSQFEGHTWYIQAVLNRLYGYRENIHTLEVVLSAIRELLEENTYAYQELLKAYSSVQVNLLKAVAMENVVSKINSGDFIAKYRLKNSSSVSRALKKLMENELIYKSEKGYIIYDRFLGLWLKSPVL